MLLRNKNRVAFLFLIGLILGGCAASKNGAGQWKNLIVNNSLEGWVQRGGKADYRVENGTIIGTSKLNTPNSFLCTDRNYADFILELEVKVDTAMNSGIQIRSNSFPEFKEGRVHGYQVEIDPSKRAWSGGIYDEARTGKYLYSPKDDKVAQAAFKNNQWNKYRIEAIGNNLKTFINGVPVTNITDNTTATGFIGLQVHSTKVPRPMEVAWRNIRIQEIKQK